MFGSPNGNPDLDRYEDMLDKEYYLEEYEQWLAEWDGDLPADQEWMNFDDWMEENYGEDYLPA